MIRLENSRANEPDEIQYGHGVFHLANTTNLYEIQRLNNFEFIVDLSSNGSGTPVDFYDPLENSLSDVNGIVRLSVSKAFIPHFTQSPIEIKRGNASFKYAGVPEFGNGTLQCNDFIGLYTKEALMGWQQLSYNVKTQKVGLAKDYKKVGNLFEYSPDYQLVRQWLLTGCWCSGLSESDYDYEQNGKQQISCTITYDWAELVPTE